MLLSKSISCKELYSLLLIMSDSLKARQASVGNAWEDLKKHGAALALTYLTLIVIGVVTFVVYLVISAIFTQIGGGNYSDSGPVLGMLFGQIGILPLSLISNLVSILFIAIPAVYFSSEEPVTFGAAVHSLKSKPGRYLIAGILFFAAYFLGLVFCVIPGLAVLLVMPIYVNKVFNTDLSVLDAFSSSFSVVFKGEGWSFIGVQILTGIVVTITTVCTCGVGGLFVVPMAAFYLQNVAYNKGLLTQ